MRRSLLIWVCFQLLLWSVFVLSYTLNKQAWINTVIIVSRDTGWMATLFYIIASNLVLCFLIAAGNIFVRFGPVTPGLVILIMQGVLIGWMAGSNGFEVPFTGVLEANIRYLKVGLWETTAYSTIYAVTMTKSLLISDSFPAKKWSKIRKLEEIKFTSREIFITAFALLCLVTAAVIETNLLVL